MPKTIDQFSGWNARIKTFRAEWKWKVRDGWDRLTYPPFVERRLLAGRHCIERPPPTRVRRLYVDISVIAKSDAGTGIQRVVRSVFASLTEICDRDVEILPLVVTRRRDGYRTQDGQPIRGGPDAIFFGLDFATDSIYRYRKELVDFRQAGGRTWFLLHDILPLSHPHWFTPASRLKYRRWLRVCAEVADGFLCVSPVVKGLLGDLLRKRYGLRQVPHIATISLGSVITAPDTGPTASRFAACPDVMERAAIIVGTLEPRKGHVDVLAAFERLWTQGSDIPLVLIGKAGWDTRKLQDHIRGHALAGTLLFWFDDVDDHGLHAAYAQCRMVIVPSLAEGYGLPLDEALAYGAPVLARDIPVFRRHREGENIAYFPERGSAASLAETIAAFYRQAQRKPAAEPPVQWRQTARQCLTAIGCPVLDVAQLE